VNRIASVSFCANENGLNDRNRYTVAAEKTPTYDLRQYRVRNTPAPVRASFPAEPTESVLLKMTIKIVSAQKEQKND
jgi:hypothetical protein